MAAYLAAQPVSSRKTLPSEPFFSETIGKKFVVFSNYVSKAPYIGKAVDTLLVDIPGYISIAVLSLAEAITRMAIGIITGPLVGIYQRFCNKDPRASINFYYERNFSLFSTQSVVVKLGYGMIFPIILISLVKRIINCVKHYLSCCNSSSKAARETSTPLPQPGSRYAAVPSYTAAGSGSPSSGPASYGPAAVHRAPLPTAPGSSEDNPRDIKSITRDGFLSMKATLLNTTETTLEDSGEAYTPFTYYDLSNGQWIRFSIQEDPVV